MHRLQPLLSRRKYLLLFIVIVVGVLVYATTSVTFAKSRLPLPPQDCAHVSSFSQCNHADPVVQGCTADAQTLQAVGIELQGVQVGLLQLRHSTVCDTFWGRTFSTTKGQAELSLSSPSFNENVPDTSGSPLFTGGPNEVYSDMIFGNQSPLLTGLVVFSGGVTQAQAQIQAQIFT